MADKVLSSATSANSLQKVLGVNGTDVVSAAIADFSNQIFGGLATGYRGNVDGLKAGGVYRLWYTVSTGTPPPSDALFFGGSCRIRNFCESCSSVFP